MKTVFILLAIAAIAAAQTYPSDNYHGYGDTSNITSFKKDSLRYSKVFPLSAMHYTRIDVYCNDTDAAGFAGDSVYFSYGIQTGHPCYNSSGTRDTAWTRPRVTIDTINFAGSRVFMDTTTSKIDSLGNYNDLRGLIDTVSVLGYAVQSHDISLAMPWDVYFRVWFKGVTGNNVGTFIKLRCAMIRGMGLNVRMTQ